MLSAGKLDSIPKGMQKKAAKQLLAIDAVFFEM
jgi:hypothetical protein